VLPYDAFLPWAATVAGDGDIDSKTQVGRPVELYLDAIGLPDGRQLKRLIGRAFEALTGALLEQGRDEDSAGRKGRIPVTAGVENDAVVVGCGAVIWRSDVNDLHSGGGIVTRARAIAVQRQQAIVRSCVREVRHGK